MSTNKTSALVLQLADESDRFHDLAKDLALEILFKPDSDKQRLAREHAIRSETFRTAATMVSNSTSGTATRRPSH